MFNRALLSSRKPMRLANVIGHVVAAGLAVLILCILGCDKEDIPVAVQSPGESISNAGALDTNMDDPTIQATPPHDITPEIDIPRPHRPNRMVLVPAGSFTMSDGEAYCGEDERLVTLTNDFYLGQYEVTNGEYRDALQWAYNQGYVTATASTVQDNLDGSTVELVDLDDSDCEISFSGGTFSLDSGKEDHPVIEVSWYGAARYCDWLSLQSGLSRAYDHSSDWSCNGGDPYGATGYRLPTDAEWEYAAQYNDERVYPWGNESPSSVLANYNYDVGWTTPVGNYPAAPAALDLYDMAGNVWEWCNDRHVCNLGTTPAIDPTGPGSGSYRVLRGGSWLYRGFSLRCATRYYGSPSGVYGDSGFRCARSH